MPLLQPNSISAYYYLPIVPNWFEANDHNLIPTIENETAALGPGSSRAPSSHATRTKWSVDRPGAICTSEPRVGAKEDCTEGVGANVASTVKSEVEDSSPNWAIAVDQSTSGIKGFVDYGTCNQAYRGTDGGSELERPVGVAGPTATPTSEGVEGDTRSFGGFWQLLADAGYGVW